jgi:hypothetical protein
MSTNWGEDRPERLGQYLLGLTFPAFKDDVVRAARHGKAPQDVVAVLERIPVIKFSNLDELAQQYSAQMTEDVSRHPPYVEGASKTRPDNRGPGAKRV